MSQYSTPNGTTFGQVKRVECDTEEGLCRVIDTDQRTYEVRTKKLYSKGEVRQADYISDNQIRLHPLSHDTLTCQYTGDTNILRCSPPDHEQSRLTD